MNEERVLQANVGVGAGTDSLHVPTASSSHHEANIVRAENGFIVRIGCKVFVFSEWVLASEGLALYFKNPEEAYKKYCRC